MLRAGGLDWQGNQSTIPFAATTIDTEAFDLGFVSTAQEGSAGMNWVRTASAALLALPADRVRRQLFRPPVSILLALD